MYIPKDEVLTQFKTVPKFIGMMETHASQYNELDNTLGMYVDAYSLSSAVGSQLDALGFLLGMERPLSSDLSKYFTFVGGIGKGFGNRFGTIDGGQLLGYSEDSVARATDVEYRNLLFIKLYANLSKTTPDDMIRTVNDVTGAICIYMEGYEDSTPEPAKAIIKVLGGNNPAFVAYLMDYLAKPLGVSLEIRDLPASGTAVEAQVYTGTGAGTTLTTVNDMTLGISYFKNLNAVGDNMLVSNITGERNAISINNTNPQKDIGVQYIIDKTTQLNGAEVEANKAGDVYMMFSMHMTSREVVETSDGLSAEYIVNDFTGFGAVEWTGSGSSEQHIRIPFSRPVSMMMAKDMSGGDMTVVGAVLDGYKMKMNSDAPLERDDNPELRLLSAGIAVEGSYNIKGEKYLAWIINENRAYSVIDQYASTGTAGFELDAGISISILMIKSISTNGDWLYFSKDVMGATNPKSIRMNSDQPALDDNLIEFTAQGFKLLTTSNDTNADGHKYMYMAIKA